MRLIQIQSKFENDCVAEDYFCVQLDKQSQITDNDWINMAQKEKTSN